MTSDPLSRLRAGLARDRRPTVSDHRIEIDAADPYLVGEHFTVGDRFEVDPAEHGIVLPPVPDDIRERWSTGPAPRWEITIGETGDQP